jgi:hypothetical protein
LRKSETGATQSLAAEIALDGPLARERNEMREPVETIYVGLETGPDFLAWIRRNPLKSPDSDEENQANPSYFAWFYLDLFGRIWRNPLTRF